MKDTTTGTVRSDIAWALPDRISIHGLDLCGEIVGEAAREAAGGGRGDAVGLGVSAVRLRAAAARRERRVLALLSSKAGFGSPFGAVRPSTPLTLLPQT